MSGPRDNDNECAVHSCHEPVDGDRLLCTHHYNMGSGDTDRTPMPDGRDEPMQRLDDYFHGDYEYPVGEGDPPTV